MVIVTSALHIKFHQTRLGENFEPVLDDNFKITFMGKILTPKFIRVGGDVVMVISTISKALCEANKLSLANSYPAWAVFSMTRFGVSEGI